MLEDYLHDLLKESGYSTGSEEDYDKLSKEQNSRKELALEIIHGNNFPAREGYPAEPPSDFTLWVVVNKWQYDHVQHKWYNTFVEQMKGKVFSHAELYQYWKENN